MEQVMNDFTGTMDQLPPMYSALKFKGKPYYAYARKGIEIPRTPRSVTIYSFSLLSVELPYWDARVVCSRGTYVRTLVEDVAERLGTCATLVELVRERVGYFRRENALPWHDLRMMAPTDVWPLIVPVTSEPVLAHA
jgi:tRNA pseudouridine55 synthase